MQNKKMKRLGSVLLTAALTMSSLSPMTVVQAEEAVTQMASDKEIVYVNAYGDDAREQNFDSNWKFYLGDATGAEAAGFDDSTWSNVNLPHDYSIEQEYTSAGEAESAYLLGGTGWYRKHFSLNSELEGKEIRIDFGGVYMNATVWVNGTQLGTHPYGYTPFSFDITDQVKFGEENVITVKVEHQTPSSRWYSGSGIYRSVNLTVMDKVHVELYGTHITTPNLETEKGGTVNMTVKTTIANEGTEAKDAVLVHTIYEKGTQNSIGTVTTEAQSVAAGAKADITATLPAANPNLWDIKDPNLYTVVTEVKVGDEVVDTYETEYGFRYIKFDANTGFYLNGENVKLKGVCMHHDQGSLGSEAHYRAIERQVEILKDMGCNSIRVTHNPAADELIEICNEKGILVIDEFFDGWHMPKNGNTYDYSTSFSKAIEDGNEILGAEDGMTWAEFDMKATIGRGENSPAVIMWSLGNEIQEGAGGSGYAAIADNLIAWAQETGTTKLLTIGSNAVKTAIGNSNNEHVQIANKLTAVGGVSGTNYSGGSSYDSMHSTYPNWFIYGSETASHVNSRGVYNVTGSQQLNSDKALTSYDYSAVGWGATASSAWYDVITRDFVAGEYVWTGFDYLGEPTPNNGTDAGWKNGTDSPKNSFFGIVDTAGLPKDNYYFYQSQWNDEVNTLHVLPAWNSDVLANTSSVPVVVYSDAKSVNLTLTTADGTVTDLGTKTFTTKTTGAGYTYQMYEGSDKESTTHRNLYLTWYVPFQEGTLTATAYDANGQVITNTVGRSSVKTTGNEAKLAAKVDRETIDADGKDLAYITIDVTDADGNIVPDAKNNVTVTVEGDGVLVGMDNGKQSDHQSYQDDNRNAFNGSLVAIVQSTKTAGEFTVTATAEGLDSASVTVETADVNAKQDVTFNMSKNYYVKVGNAPQLPDVIETKVADAAEEELMVVWEEISADAYGEVGTFTVSGVVDGSYDVSVTVNMIDEVGGLLNYSTVTPVGVLPTLPENRPAVMLDGTILSAAFAVEWDEITAENVAEAGTFVVNGTANVLGNEVAVTAAVRVQEDQVTIGDSISSQAAKLTQNIAADLQSDTLAAIKDGSTTVSANNDGGANESMWSNYASAQAGNTTAQIIFEYDTQQRFGEIVIHFVRDGYSAEWPDANTTEIYLSENGSEWTKLDATETMGTANGQVKPYTYSFAPATATFVRLNITNSTATKTAKPCTGIVEVELKKAVSGAFTANTATGLSALTVAGAQVGAAALAAGEYNTPARNPEVLAAGADNAAVTVLPAYEGVILVITEAEDHSAREIFTINLGKTAEPSADSTAFDYPLNGLVAISGSEYAATTGNEGHDGFVLDNQTSTHWHTDWANGATADQLEERWIGVNITDGPAEIAGVRYLPRQTGNTNGSPTEYNIQYKASDDGEWTDITTGTWDANDRNWKLVTFPAVEAKQIRVLGVHTYADSGNDAHMSCSEFRVLVPTEVYKAELAAMIAEAEALTADNYTEETWAVLETALAAANTVNADAAATQNQVYQAMDDLQAAMDALTEKGEDNPEPEKEVCENFKDVLHGAWYEEAIQYVYDAEIMTGTGAAAFEPETDVTRAMVVETLYKMEGRPDVSELAAPEVADYQEGAWWADALKWAMANGIATGDINTKAFNAEQAVTREQLATFLFRYASYKGLDTASDGSKDEVLVNVPVSNWAETAFTWAVEEGLITGFPVGDGFDFAPQRGANRAQLATILMRFMEE